MVSNLFDEAWQVLESAIVEFDGNPIGTVAARDPGVAALNYDQVFTRDFAVSAIAFLLNDKKNIVKNFLSAAVDLQSREKQLDCFQAGEGLMPASFKVEAGDSGKQELVPDFGERPLPVWLRWIRASGGSTFSGFMSRSREIGSWPGSPNSRKPCA